MMKRYFYILLLCACAMCSFVGNAAAQIKDGDVVTIRNGNNYLGVNNNANAIENITDLSTAKTRALWTVTISGNAYSFVSVVNDQKELRGSNNALSLTATGSSFTFNGTNANGGYVATGTLAYSNNRYIRYNNGWKVDRSSTSLTIEKWELKSEKGEVKITATANPTTITFDTFVDDDTAESKDITVTVSSASTKEKEYYQNLNNSSQTILVSEKEVVGDSFEISGVSATWSSNTNNSIYSSTNCEVFGESASTRHNLLKIESVTPGADNKSCTISISTVGNSPMEMKEGEKWKDYTDVLVVAFRNADPNIDATYRGYFNITRYSFHKEELPEFEVKTNLSDNNLLFSKGGGEEIINISCVHQHGASILHYSYDHDGATEIVKEIDKIYEEEPTTITDLSFAQFAAKSVIDETNVDWVTLSHSANGPSDGKLTLSVEENRTNIARSARLVGQFNYQCPANSEVTHSAILQIPITQNAKDGAIKFVHNKGIYNTQFGINPYTQEDEQLVHTTEKIIYYQAGTNITLNLPEKRFQGYKRWYDYKTGDDPACNASASDRADWETAPQGTRINNEYGDTYGIYDTENREANTPVITASWTDNKEHIIACDLSNYKDYKIDKEGQTTTSITEPTLSYRQLFRLRPAEWIADTLTTMSLEGKYFEVHNYMAPTGENIYLATNYHHSLATATDNSYFYNNANNQLTRVSGARWYKDGVEVTGTYSYDVKDYFKISSNSEGTVRYELRVPGKLTGGKDVLIARFVVTFVSPTTHGPTTTEIISRDKILSDYVMLEEINFNYSLPTSTTANQQLYHPLPWGESTYGYYYPDGVLGGDEMYHQHTNRSGNNIPYTGEYFLVNSLDLEWADQANRGGANQGYVLYVDGAEEPGLVASISTDATICSGQTMYCSMWLCNPSRNRGSGTYCDPIFRCNIQGRNAGDSEWTDVGVYFVGDLPWGPNNSTGGSWHQVKFPIDSEVSYDETRVQIYNFGTGESGNDFMVDDICLFVSPLSLAAYQATMGCQSFTGISEASTAVVVRVDYARLNKDLQNRYVYYRLFNTTDNKVVKLKTLSANNEVVSAYYAEDSEHISEEYGSVKIPAVDYSPTTGAGDNIQTSLASYMDYLMTNNLRHGKCYVKDANNNWYLYLMHIIPNTQSNVYGQDEDIYLVKDKDYLITISNNQDELNKTECSSTTELHATTDTYVELHDADGGVERVDCRDKLCANNQYFLDVKVQNTLATGIGGNLETLVATVHADWLIGEPSDDVYCTPRSMTSEDKDIADEAFYTAYGCTRNDLRKAIGGMRQVPTNDVPNPNYRVADANELVVTSFFDNDDLLLIKRLCNEGKLSLYQISVRFYMGSEETVRYWAYPIAEDATVMFNGKEYTLYDCDEPKWVKLTSDYSEYAINLSPIDKVDQTAAQRLDVPSVRILEGTETVTVPIRQLIGAAKLNSILAPTSDEITFRYDAVIPGVLEYVEFLENRIAVVSAPEQLKPGEDYLMRMAFYNAAGQAYEKDCRVGFAYFYLSIVPKTVQWTGEFSNQWGDDRNWQGVKEDGSLMEGNAFTPLPETNVIIRANTPVSTITTTDEYPMDVNHHPNACNKIYFEHGATIHNQHLLVYSQAFVDMKIEAANWNSMAPPLKGMYTGDMYVPHNGMYDGTTDGKNAEYNNVEDHSDYPFVVNSFQGTRTSKAPYVFWQSVYNKSATVYHENGNQSHHPASSETATFVQTNSLGQALPVGSGYQVLGYGPTHKEDDEIIVRLPKPDNYYSYFYKDGTESEQRAYVDHSSSHRLAFEPDDSGNMHITLKNDIPSNKFMFGNPTMNYIDMAKFLASNTHISAYYQMENSSWQVGNSLIAGTLAPMRSVLLVLPEEDAKTSITVTLSASHLVGNETPDQNAPARKQVVSEEPLETQLMTIYASCENGQARCMLASNAYAHDIYNGNEDALFISSGVENGVNSATATSPINMYTVSEQVPMMVDVRENIDTVPVSMLVHDSYRTEKVKFSFYLSINWNKECYFYDAVTGERHRIMDGLWLEKDMPLNHETRYFITGPDHTTNSGVVTNTTNPNVAPLQVWAYSEQAGEITVRSNDIIQSVTIYDIAGHIIARQTLDLLYNQVSMPVGQGIHIAEVTLRDNSKHYTRTIVK